MSAACANHSNSWDEIDDDVGDIRFATAAEVERWDELILACTDEGTIYRSSANIDGMALGGVTPVRLMVRGYAVTAFEVRVFPFGRLWVVLGPPARSVQGLVEDARRLACFAAREGVCALRVRPQLRDDPDDREALQRSGLHRVPVWLEDHTVIVDLSVTEDQLFRSFKKRARKRIRRAQRAGVTVERVAVTPENCALMYDMMEETSGGRFGIPARGRAAAVLQRFAATDNGSLFFADHGGRVVAGAFVAVFGEDALYFAGGSIRLAPGDPYHCGLGRTGAAYALQWEAMRWARRRGCVRYDLDGTPSTEQIGNEAHPRHGVGRFKTAFADEITDYLGAYQVGVKPVRAELLRRAERAAQRIDQSPLCNRIRRRDVPPNPDYVWLQ